MTTMIFPFQRLFRDLVLQIESLTIDGDGAPADLIEPSTRTVSIRGIGRDVWNTAELSVVVEFPIQEVRDRGIAEDGLSVLLQLACDATDLRATERLRVVNGKARGTIGFKRDLVTDRVSIVAILCEAGADGIPRILKESSPWNLAIATSNTRTPRPPRAPGTRGLAELFSVQWVDFEERPHLRPYSNELYFVDASTAGRPSLYLNKTIRNYSALLSDRPGSSAFERALRDIEYRRISLGAWFAALLHALEGVSIDEDTNDITYPDGWRRDVLELILSRLRPNQSMELTARTFARARSDGHGYAVLLGQLQVSINQMLDVTTVLRRHLTAVGRQDVGEEQSI